MDNLSSSRVWVMRAAYLGLALLIIFFQLLPLSTLPPFWAWPDLLLAITFAWAMRRPDYVPALSIAGVMLLSDLILMRPPGLMAALVVFGAAQLKNRTGGLRDASFVGEWVAAGMMMVLVVILNRVILATLIVDQAPLGLTLIQLIMTIAAYPAVVLLSHVLLGVRKLSPNSEDALGARA
ncbi:rod shape-determining protein MreD [Thalassococcus sp. S3]|uniref:rod shape-determining protein MreD n=1 Tax=Thalassococcus sp. S3 TaxID=2017482 RepID=UPI0010241CFF|nr:rod shape-determining protein MreD [Thalassococcus sp. S3]QBF30260.1 rod shape-determining protein MreD [Thalassococcus sp. S3]